jgi:hypothetical protein
MHYERAFRGYGNTRRIRDLTTVLLGRSSLLKNERALLGISKAGDVIGTNGNVYSGRMERAFWLTGHGDLLGQERGKFTNVRLPGFRSNVSQGACVDEGYGRQEGRNYTSSL